MIVASFTDAWIETKEYAKELYRKTVASFTDAWIETFSFVATFQKSESHLLQMRGLKLVTMYAKVNNIGRIFYRCVD